jgi:glycosyltransferase involved in cell wall biosynthesis
MRVAISQRFLPHYRVGFFDRLDSELREHGGELRVFYSYAMGALESRPPWARRIAAVRKDLQLGELEDSAVVAPSLVWHLAHYAPDVVVLEDLGGLPNSLLGAAYCRLRNRPYLVWGLGNVPHKKRSRLRRMLAPMIAFLYDGAFGFVCYSQHAADVYRCYGKPTYVAPNSYLSPPCPSERERIERGFEQRYAQTERRMISIGTLRRQKRYDVLLSAIARMPRQVALDLIGDGPEAATLEKTAAELGISDRVVFHGAIYSAEVKARLFARAHIGVVPGRGGLAIQEMMSYGVPVISGVADGTERDLIRDGENGYLLDGFATVEQLVAAVTRFLARTPSQQVDLARAAFATVIQRSNTSVMAGAFVRALGDAACT